MPGRQIVGKVFICILVAALVINGAYWIHNVEERTASYSAEKADGVFNMALQKVPTEQSKKHDIVLEDRKNMKLTGIVEISSFDERKIVMQTEQDQLTVTGNLLHIRNFNTQTGEVRLEGIIDSLVYSEKKKKDRIRLWDKIFR